MAEIRHVDVLEPLLKANDYLARRLQQEWTDRGTLVVNLLSSPGAGKTTLLEATLRQMRDRFRILVLEGDIETDRDAERIRALGVDAVQITTGGTCHLEAHMIEQAWRPLADRTGYDFIFIENVGNLVCPASYALGEHLRVVLLSVPEGDDKPKKYPKAFRTASVLLITKWDLLPHFDFNPDHAQREALDLNPDLTVLRLSARTGEGIDAWIRLLEESRQRIRSSR